MELSRRPSRNPCHAWYTAGCVGGAGLGCRRVLEPGPSSPSGTYLSHLPMSNIIMACLKRSKVRVPCTQSQFMRFVLAAGLLTRSYPIPNPNPQALVMCSVLSTRGVGGRVLRAGCNNRVEVECMATNLLIRLAGASIDHARPCCRPRECSTQDLSADKVVHAEWVRWCTASLPAARDLHRHQMRQTNRPLEPGRGEETNSTLTGTFAG